MNAQLCADCGKPIPAKRLKAVPTALYCCACQPCYDTLTGPCECKGIAVPAEMDGDQHRPHGWPCAEPGELL